MAELFSVTATKGTSKKPFAAIILIKSKLKSTYFPPRLNIIHFFWKEEPIFGPPPPRKEDPFTFTHQPRAPDDAFKRF